MGEMSYFRDTKIEVLVAVGVGAAVSSWLFWNIYRRKWQNQREELEEQLDQVFYHLSTTLNSHRHLDGKESV